MSALLLAAALTASGPNCVDAMCNARVLTPFFDKLAASTRTPGKRPIHIIQIGDSHTAGDTITGGWRDLLQAKYGGGGRGLLPPGRPYQGYLTRGVTAEMSAGWQVSSIFGANSAPPRPLMGLSGFSITSRQPGARIALNADAGQMFDRFTLCAAAMPGAGSLTIRVGAAAEQMDLNSYSARPVCKTLTFAQPQFRVDVSADTAPVTIMSWATFRDNGGIALSNVGVVGSQLSFFARTDDAVLDEEFRAYRPDLIIIEFGTNEGFSPVFRPQEYEITLRTQIGRLRRLAGNVPILLFGAPDASTRRTELLHNAPGPTPAPCAEPGSVPAPVQAAYVAPEPAGPARRTLADVIADLDGNATNASPPPAVVPYPAPAAPAAPAAPRAVSSQGWSVRANPLFPPAGLASVRDVQRRVATSLNVAFWDWEARMGGRCASVKFVKGSPPLMRGDYVHFNSAGGREVASRLNIDMERAAAAAARR